MLAALYNVPIDPADLQRFSFHNQDEHILAAEALFRQRGARVQQFVLDPIPANNFSFWLYQHQSSHNEINALLETGGNDLSTLNPDNREELEAWIEIHAAEHAEWCRLLGIP